MDRQTQEKARRKSNGIDDFDRFVNGVIRTTSSTTRTPLFFFGWGLFGTCMGLSRLGNVLSVMMWAMEVYNLQLAHAWFVPDKIKWPPARHTHKKKI